MIDTDLSRYETYLRSEERSANTIAKYLRDLRVFFTFMGNESLCKEAVVSFKGYLTESYAPASVNSMLAAVNGFLEWSGMPQMKVKPLKIQKCLFAKPEKRTDPGGILAADKSSGGKRQPPSCNAASDNLRHRYPGVRGAPHNRGSRGDWTGQCGLQREEPCGIPAKSTMPGTAEVLQEAWD